MELVKNIIVNLAKNLNKTRDIHIWQPLAVEEFLRKDDIARAVSPLMSHVDMLLTSTVVSLQSSSTIQYTLVLRCAERGGVSDHSQTWTSAHCPQSSDEEQFSRGLVENLITKLEEQPLPHLTPNEHEYLLVLIQATLEVSSRKILDSIS